MLSPPALLVLLRPSDQGGPEYPEDQRRRVHPVRRVVRQDPRHLADRHFLAALVGQWVLAVPEPLEDQQGRAQLVSKRRRMRRPD